MPVPGQDEEIGETSPKTDGYKGEATDSGAEVIDSYGGQLQNLNRWEVRCRPE
jgi:hypothetical protein